MKKRIVVHMVALLAAALGFASPVQAEVARASDDEALVRVVNYHKTDVRVFVYDADGRRQLLGVVQTGEYQELELARDLISAGPIQVKVYPVSQVAGLGTPSEGDNGVKSNLLELDEGDVLDFWLEPNLEASMVKVTRG